MYYPMELIDKAKNYAKSFDLVGYNKEQIGAVETAFIDGAQWQKDHVWHKPDEPIEHDEEVLIEYKNGFHDAGYYDKDEEVFYTGGDCYPKRNDITRWAYIKDLY